jgi:ribosomal protein S18 acetylase RimI-like enzyme
MSRIRPMQTADRSQIQKILNDTGFFSNAEIEVAMELVDIYLNKPDQKDYILYVTEGSGSQISGYICFGPTPVAEGTYDLYWIAVDPQSQNQGVGKKLLEFFEQEVTRRQGRLIIIETSSQEKYKATQAFYLHNNYHLAAQIKDFYKPGDDRLIFTKYIDN